MPVWQFPANKYLLQKERDKHLKAIMQSTDMETLDLLVQRSLQQYGEMFELLQTRGQQLDCHSTDHIQDFNETFTVLQKVAKRTDQKLLEKLKAAEFTESIAGKLARREEMQEKILVLLKETASRANSVKSLLASELQSIKHGRKALSGYKTNPDQQGRLLNKRS